MTACPAAFGHVGPTVHGLKSPEPQIRSEDPRTPLPGTSAAGSAVRSVKRSIVREGLEVYLTDLRRHGRPDTAREAEWRFKTVIYDDVIADLELESVTRDDFLE